MDKVKVYLKVLKKHHFWVLAALVVLVSFSVWSSATGKLEEEFKKNKTRIESSSNMVGQIVPDSPNETFKDGVENLRGDLRKHVFSSWQEMYKVQKPRFVWPKLVDGIGQVRTDFISNWDAIFPPAGAAPPTAAPPADGAPASPPKNPKTECASLNTKTVTLRQSYNNNVVREELKRLFKLVRVRTERRRVAPADGNAKNVPGPRNAEEAAEFDGIVFWDEAQRIALNNRYYSGGATPELGRVLTTQEDLWIFESMLGVIELLNKDAKDPLAAVIKRIEFLDVAQWAIKDSQVEKGVVERFTQARVDGLGLGGNPAGGPAQGMPGADATTTVKAKDESEHWFNYRYLDENMQPLAFSTPQPFAEFKQVFVRMQVLMDQRKLPDLLAACANASLPIEVRQVRMSLDDKTGVGKRAGAGGGNVMGGPKDKIDPGPYDGFVDVRGIVYIYNKPDEDKVGKGASGTPAKRMFGIPTQPADLPTAANGPGGQRP